ncbi:MAG: DNA replication and repair protein RecF [Candidatus Latescibacteria bacterium]|nr:DNA replication and repair protein RecF [Candidatus Latescibacterota bacterium]
MRIRELILQPFRNFAQFSLAFEADRTLILGHNGQGKSNVLEAISYLSIGKSIRGSQDRQVVPHGEKHFDVQGLCNDGQRDCQIRVFYAGAEGKKAFCDGAALPRVSDILGTFKTVHFSPEDVSLVLRFPAQRRRALDILISQSSLSYLRDLQRYMRTLAQRNHLLRTAQKNNQALSEGVLEPWDAQVAELGSRIRAQRLSTLEAMCGPFAAYYQRFSQQREHAALVYQGPTPGTEEELRAQLLAELAEKRERELRQGHTLCGPQRDDLSFRLDDKPAEIYGSEGQLKTILISWKLAEVRFLEQLGGQMPVLLLDDALSELDAKRAEQLLEIVDEFEQVILTTPWEPEAGLKSRFAEIRLSA